jgi:crotonobetainyl-CoA:carnitine CoA-transferase CaiB-like acyl-CoA transferase
MLMGVYQRNRLGAPVAAEVSLLGSALFLLAELVQRPNGTLTGAPLLNSSQTGFHPAEQLYATRDGWIAIAARSTRAAAALAAALGLHDFPPREHWVQEQAKAIAARLRSLSVDDALALLCAAEGVWVERCRRDGWRALRADKEARARGLVIDVADSMFGNITGCFGPCVTLSRTSPHSALFRSAPAAGAQTREILDELGL